MDYFAKFVSEKNDALNIHEPVYFKSRKVGLTNLTQPFWIKIISPSIILYAKTY